MESCKVGRGPGAGALDRLWRDSGREKALVQYSWNEIGTSVCPWLCSLFVWTPVSQGKLGGYCGHPQIASHQSGLSPSQIPKSTHKNELQAHKSLSVIVSAFLILSCLTFQWGTDFWLSEFWNIFGFMKRKPDGQNSALCFNSHRILI